MIKQFAVSARNAWRGFCLAAKGRNFKIELFAAAWALLLNWTGDGGAWRYCAVLAACALVIGAESLNTALEKLCDRVSGEREDAIRDSKDIGAGAVLVCAAAALGIAVAAFASAGFWQNVIDSITKGGNGWAAVMLVLLPVAAVLLSLPSKRGERPDVQYYPTVEKRRGDKGGNGADGADGGNAEDNGGGNGDN